MTDEERRRYREVLAAKLNVKTDDEKGPLLLRRFFFLCILGVFWVILWIMMNI